MKAKRPASQSSVEKEQTAKLVIIFSLGLCGSVFVFVPILYTLSGPLAAAFLLATGVMLAATPLVQRWSGSVTVTAHYFLVGFWILLSGIAIIIGARLASSFSAYPILIIAATFLIGRKSGLVWTVISLATLSLLWFALDNWIHPPKLSVKALEVLYLLNLLAVFSLICGFSLLYDTAKNRALAEVSSSNKRITSMITQLEEASDRLVLSSEHFLGSESDRSTGLVSQMMFKARSGRESIEESRSSISGMIGQYQQIATRVQQLHKHSQTIIEMVSTIDRISDRLDLMALNVGIESIQGGDSGKQFGVIAGDMRRLAERVLSETSQIKRALGAVHVQVQQVLEASTVGQTLTEESAGKMATMVTTFDDMFALISKTEGATEQITADTLSQLAAVRKLVQAAADSDGTKLN